MRIGTLLSALRSRIWIRLLAFNLLLVFLPAAGLLYFEVYEKKLLDAQERSMVQQGRLVAAALASSSDLSADATRLLASLRRRTVSRIRVVDLTGRLLADSSREQGGDISLSGVSPDAEDARASPLYRLGRKLYLAIEALGVSGEKGTTGLPEYRSDRPLMGPEIRAALDGNYGAEWRISPGQRSVTLYSALPIIQGERVMGVVLVSQSTVRLLSDLYDVRLAVFKVVLLSVAAAAILTILLSRNIGVPITRLRETALGILDRRGRPGEEVEVSMRQDEIGDLANALHELSRRLQERVLFIESLASDISHELKNPLASIRSASEVLEAADNPQDKRRFAEVIQKEIARMEELLSALREVTLIDTRLETEERVHIELNAFTREFAGGFRTRRGGAIDLSLRGAESPLYVLVAPDRIEQVLENILDNALSYSSTVTIGLSRVDAHALLDVRDQGPGFSEEDLSRVFDRFFSSRSGQDKSEHMGLGLAVVKAIVEGYGGGVSARNDEQGGAVVSVSLPLVGGWGAEPTPQ
jgi:two-component system sensor histidine kinase ChvG